MTSYFPLIVTGPLWFCEHIGGRGQIALNWGFVVKKKKKKAVLLTLGSQYDSFSQI